MGKIEDRKNTYVILGSGIAGMRAAEAIRNTDPNPTIRMITSERDLCFNRPMLVKDFALDGSGEELFERQERWPAECGVELMRDTRAERIEPDSKRIYLSTGEAIYYDKLIYAIGAEASIPRVPGSDGKNVFTVRTREDMAQIREAMKLSKSAVVIGGGMLGLEDAWAMKEQKLDVSIVEQRQRLAFAQIDQSAGNLIKKRIERMGVPVYLDAEVEEIGDGYVTFRQEAATDHGATNNCSRCCCSDMKDRVTIPADMVIFSTGVTPNTYLGLEAGLEMFESSGVRWVAVDETCRTSDGDIFAAGDAAAVKGRNDAIWDEAREMGRIAGTNAALDMVMGDDPDAGVKRPSYTPVVPEHVFNGFDTEIFTMGDSSGAGTDGVYIRHADVEIFDYQRERYVRVSLQDGRIVGILLINAPELVPELAAACEMKAGEEDARQIILQWLENHGVDFKPASPFRHR